MALELDSEAMESPLKIETHPNGKVSVCFAHPTNGETQHRCTVDPAEARKFAQRILDEIPEPKDERTPADVVTEAMDANPVTAATPKGKKAT